VGIAHRNATPRCQSGTANYTIRAMFSPPTFFGLNILR
jgi:hypothetical protein